MKRDDDRVSILCGRNCPFQEDEHRESISIAAEMEESFGHFFDSVIPFDSVDYVFEQLAFEISLLEREPQWVPAKWVKGKARSIVDTTAS